MNNQSWQTLSQLGTAIGIILTAVGGYGSYHYGKCVEEELKKPQRPVLNLCKRGISVKQLNDTTAYFDIPYCAEKNANAYNVKLQSTVIFKTSQGYSIGAVPDEKFPENVTLTYETGKSISYTLNPFTKDMIGSTYIYIRGEFENEERTGKFNVSEIYKYNVHTSEWIQALSEDAAIRNFLKENGLL